MNWLMNWFHGARWRMSLSHCLEALLMQVPVAFIAEFLGVAKTHSWWVGALVVAVWYWSREKTQYENRVKVSGESDTTVWGRGFWPGDWGLDSMLDLVFPVASSAALALGISYWVVHRV